jgi:hypothetical protein
MKMQMLSTQDDAMPDTEIMGLNLQAITHTILQVTELPI